MFTYLLFDWMLQSRTSAHVLYRFIHEFEFINKFVINWCWYVIFVESFGCCCCCSCRHFWILVHLALVLVWLLLFFSSLYCNICSFKCFFYSICRVHVLFFFILIFTLLFITSSRCLTARCECKYNNQLIIGCRLAFFPLLFNHSDRLFYNFWEVVCWSAHANNIPISIRLHS